MVREFIFDILQVEEELTKKNEGDSSKKLSSGYDMEGGGAMGGGSGGVETRRSSVAGTPVSEVRISNYSSSQQYALDSCCFTGTRLERYSPVIVPLLS